MAVEALGEKLGSWAREGVEQGLDTLSSAVDSVRGLTRASMAALGLSLGTACGIDNEVYYNSCSVDPNGPSSFAVLQASTDRIPSDCRDLPDAHPNIGDSFCLSEEDGRVHDLFYFLPDPDRFSREDLYGGLSLYVNDTKVSRRSSLGFAETDGELRDFFYAFYELLDDGGAVDVTFKLDLKVLSGGRVDCSKNVAFWASFEGDGSYEDSFFRGFRYTLNEDGSVRREPLGAYDPYLSAFDWIFSDEDTGGDTGESASEDTDS